MTKRITESFAHSFEKAARKGQLREPGAGDVMMQVDVEAEIKNLANHRPGEEPKPLYKDIVDRTRAVLDLMR